MTIAWMSDWNRWGNGKGYSVHNGNMKKWTESLPDVEVVDDPFKAPIVLDIVVPGGYEPVPGRFNVLFTMYEMGSIPKDWIEPINLADMIIVPCEHNRQLFQRYTDKPVEVCPEGVDPALYKYVARDAGRMEKTPAGVEYREMPNRGHFNFLWVGASNPRKGYELVCQAWEMWLAYEPQAVIDNTRLILKTTKESEPEGTKWMFGAIIDTRRLSDDELVNLYNKSHAFLLPSMGEGWGLTLCEAQATGLPCVYTPWSGPVDFMDRAWSYPAKWKTIPMKAIRRLKEDGKEIEIAHQGPVACAEVKSIYQRMRQIYYGYDKALVRGHEGSYHIRSTFTWKRSAIKLCEILAKYSNQEWKAPAA